MRKLIYLAAVSVLLVSACKQATRSDVSNADVAAEQTDTSRQTTQTTVAEPPEKIVNTRYNFGFTLPAKFKAADKSNNGDGYFIETGDVGVDLRVYGESMTDNALMAELELKSCEKTESFRFDNGYPGTKCYQSGDFYYFYDTPTTRVVCYVHAGQAWLNKNAATVDQIAKSIYVAGGN